ncbi:MAG: hypothetical protein GVY11_03855 [Gammaproteobacteria bacterium]|jgi:hypothetical protein|nr:hypothetical protein [Gammaproteobacteria bacterium]
MKHLRLYPVATKHRTAGPAYHQQDPDRRQANRIHGKAFFMLPVTAGAQEPQRRRNIRCGLREAQVAGGRYSMNQEGSAKSVPRALLLVAAGPQEPERRWKIRCGFRAAKEAPD